MYGHKARESLIAVLKDDPILKNAVKLEGKGEPRLKRPDFRKIADRLLIEMWMRGFAVSSRNVDAPAPKGAPDQKAWRDEQLAPKPARPRRKKAEAAAAEAHSGD